MKSKNFKTKPNEGKNDQHQKLQKLNLEQLDAVSGGILIALLLPAVQKIR